MSLKVFNIPFPSTITLWAKTLACTSLILDMRSIISSAETITRSQDTDIQVTLMHLQIPVTTGLCHYQPNSTYDQLPICMSFIHSACLRLMKELHTQSIICKLWKLLLGSTHYHETRIMFTINEFSNFKRFISN